VHTMKMKIQAADVADRRRNGRRRGSFSHICHGGRLVTASSPCKLWLNAMRFAELSNRHCAVAQELTLAWAACWLSVCITDNDVWR
jgi:hypothetical protein